MNLSILKFIRGNYSVLTLDSIPPNYAPCMFITAAIPERLPLGGPRDNSNAPTLNALQKDRYLHERYHFNR